MKDQVIKTEAYNANFSLFNVNRAIYGGSIFFSSKITFKIEFKEEWSLFYLVPDEREYM